MSYKFETEKVTNDCINWIREWFNKNAYHKQAVIGISGGIDSAVVAALCSQALGRDRCIGVVMPNICQDDLDMAKIIAREYCEQYVPINIGKAYTDILVQMTDQLMYVSDQTRINLPARLRMSVLYAVAQSVGGMVVNTSNLSESYVGYDTLFGDQCGSLSPLGMLTKTEIREMAKFLKVPTSVINKEPADGLSGRTDEESFGFTYKELDNYLRNGGVGVAANTISEIERKHEMSEYKRQMVRLDTFQYLEAELWQ